MAANTGLVLPGERPPQTLGNQNVQTPGGQTTAEQMLGSRSEELETLGDVSLDTLKALDKQFKRIDQMEFDPRSLVNPAAGPITKRIMLRRAMNPKFDEANRQKFELVKTRELVRLSQTMASVAAQLRQADPAADAFMEQLAKDKAEAAAQVGKIARAREMASVSADLLRSEGVDVTQEMMQRLTVHFADLPDPNDAMDADIKRKKALADIEPGLPEEEEELKKLYPNNWQFIVQSRKRRVAKEQDSPAKPADFMTFQNLSREFNNLVKANEDALTTPDFVKAGMRESRSGFGQVPSVKLMNLPREPEIMREARILSLEQFKRRVEGAVGGKFVARAIERLGLQELNEDIEGRGDRTSEQITNDRELVRRIVRERLSQRALEAQSAAE